MGHLTLFERIRVIKLYNNLEVRCKYKYKVISALLKSNFGIEISDKGIVKKWQSTHKFIPAFEISLLALLARCRSANLYASRQTICRALNLMGWRKVQTKYCQKGRQNRLKRFIYACFAKRFGETFDDAF